MAKQQGRKLAIEERQERVSARYLRGESLRAIGKAEKIGATTALRDLEAIRKRWRENADINFSEYQSRELAKLDLLEAEAWAEWDRSKEDREIQVGEQSTSEDGRRSKTSVRREGQTGATEYHRSIQWCMEFRMKLLGYEPPKKMAFTSPDGTKPAPIPGMTVINLTNLSDEQLDQLERMRAAETPEVRGDPEPGSN